MATTTGNKERDLVNLVYSQITGIDKQNINSSTFVLIIPQVILLLEKTQEVMLDGPAKKNICIEVLKLIVDKSNVSDSDKVFLDSFIELTVPKLIDVFIGIAKQNINIGKNPDAMKSCCLI